MIRSRWLIGTAALLAVAVSASVVCADIDLQQGSPNSVVTFNYICPPAGPASEVVFNGPSNNYSAFRTYCVFPNQITMRADRQGNKAGSYVIARGNSAGGGFGTEALNDTVYAEDSLAVDILRNTTTNVVTLNFLYGKLINNPGIVARPSKSRVHVLVYQNDAAANADPRRLGTGAVFDATVDLHTLGTTSGLTMYGGFSGTDWTLSSGPGGQQIATAATGLSKQVPVTSAANAAVVTVVAPTSGSAYNPLPGVQPVGVGIIALLLLGSGLWYMRMRSSASRA